MGQERAGSGYPGLSQGPELEFAWVGDDAIDPLQAQTLSLLVGAGIKTREEARAELGLAGEKGVTKNNPYHDEQGRFTDGEGAVEPAPKAPKPHGAQLVTGGPMFPMFEEPPLEPPKVEPAKPSQPPP